MIAPSVVSRMKERHHLSAYRINAVDVIVLVIVAALARQCEILQFIGATQ